MKAKGAIRGKHARSFAKRASKEDWIISVEKYLLPELKLNKRMKVVDFATGSGNIIPFFKNKVKEFIAIDASEEMVNIINKKFGKIKNLKVIKSDVSKVPLESGKYDAVIIKFALHHIFNADPVVKEAYRILKKGGRLFVIDPVFEGNFVDRIKVQFIKMGKALRKGSQEFFCRYRNKKEIEDLLSRNGFKVLKEVDVGGTKTYKFFTDYMFVAKK
ncbi:methyltransferase domain-containing protein [Candidatus Woesearchaeota archaeon]|nr:methyltransferase domain-containing protein [Candidatus Woesearchaeota archaeon]